MVDRTMTSLPGELLMFVTNDRSILISLIGKRVKYDSDE